jgi:hypothetical protein
MNEFEEIKVPCEYHDLRTCFLRSVFSYIRILSLYLVSWKCQYTFYCLLIENTTCSVHTEAETELFIIVILLIKLFW